MANRASASDNKEAKPILVFGIKGRDGSTPRMGLPQDKCVEAVNVDWFESSLASKRGGASSVSLTGGTAQTGQIVFLQSHVPSDNNANRELWSIDNAATPRFKRLAGGTSWADVTLVDNIASLPQQTHAVSFNGKLYFAYESGSGAQANRLHVWDPTDAKVRRVGLALPAAATVANTGSGTYAAILRYYKVCYTVQVSGNTVRRSNPSASVSFTPSGSGTHARVTKPASISEDETHWELYASADDSNYFRIATTAVGTTTFDDNTAPAAYTGATIPDSGAYTPPPSAKYLAADDSRVIMAGAWETTAGDSLSPFDRRIWWTSALGTTDEGDDERVSNTSDIKNFDDIEEPITGLGGPLNGSIIVFSRNGMWKMIGTGIAESPYVTLRVNGGFGCISHRSIILDVDEDGDPALYWLSPQGPMRFGKDGQQRLHEDIDDLWRSRNKSPGSTDIRPHGCAYPGKHQIWWWVATGSATSPDLKIVFDTRLGRVIDVEKSIRRGWSQHNGPSAAAACSCLMSNTLGATMSDDLKPYIGRTSGTTILKCDQGTDDNGTNFQAYIKTRVYTPWGLGKTGGLQGEAMLVANASSGVTITVTMDRDLGAETLTSDCLLTAAASETVVFPKLDASRLADANAVQFQIGDSVAVSNAWNLDALYAPIIEERPR